MQVLQSSLVKNSLNPSASKYFTIWCLIFLSTCSQFIRAQSLEKAFAALNAGDYLICTAAFQQLLIKDPENPVAAYGLSKTYVMPDNKDFNLDSANRYIAIGVKGLNRAWKEQELKKNRALGYREFTVKQLEKSINELAFQACDSVDEIEQWNHFIANYNNTELLQEAVERRNVLAFNAAMRAGDYSSYEEFLRNYPDARQVKEAKALYEKLLYLSKTSDSTWQAYHNFYEKFPESPFAMTARSNYEWLLFQDKTKNHQLQEYISFLNEYPHSPYAPVVEDSVYRISTKDHQLSQYLDFLSAHPTNRNVNKAWAEVYKLENMIYSPASFKRFLAKYPQYPNKRQLDRDLMLSAKKYTPFQQGDLYGYFDSTEMKVKITPRFTEAAPFSEGLAAVMLPCESLPCSYSYVTLEGRMLSTVPWSEANDFHEGLALVSVGNCSADSCSYGFINRFGEWVIAPDYDDAFEFTDELALVRIDQKGYGYINKSGKMVIPIQYGDAAPFSEGLAAVQPNDSMGWYGYIDTAGQWAIKPAFTEAGMFSESLAPAANDKGMWGYINHDGTWSIPPKFEAASPFLNGIASVVVKSKNPKNSKLFIMKEKKIDKNGKLF